MRFFVGLDVSSFDMKVCVLDQDGARVDTFLVSNDLPGATKLNPSIRPVYGRGYFSDASR
ncbi:hypothetical protein ACE1TI_13010 [Alteribacillus sp. JSM 102045]|uniref:hypothetical protein n=1 Tax=Alteribacillus sp. JSM 102045 TaxID=1562101 RepID=UPI0035C233B2